MVVYDNDDTRKIIGIVLQKMMRCDILSNQKFSSKDPDKDEVPKVRDIGRQWL